MTSVMEEANRLQKEGYRVRRQSDRRNVWCYNFITPDQLTIEVQDDMSSGDPDSYKMVVLGVHEALFPLDRDDYDRTSSIVNRMANLNSSERHQR